MISTRFALVLLPLLACQAPGPTSGVKAEHDHGNAEQPAVHGMLMVGDGPVYLSHLPMFHAPHDYQVLLEVSLLQDGTDPTAVYAQDRHVTGEKIYTVVPEPFVLSELFTPAAAPSRTTFRASLVRGHFERGGQTFLTNVTVRVTRVVFAKKFEHDPTPPPNLQYLTFGNNTELFAAHVITKVPDFDHVVAVRAGSGVLTEAQATRLRAGALINFPGTANTVDQALVEGASVTGRASLGGAPVDLGLDVLTGFYLETGDLSF